MIRTIEYSKKKKKKKEKIILTDTLAIHVPLLHLLLGLN